jgi:transketolase
MALGARLQERDYRVFVLLGDGELNEGQVWEAAMSASHFQLGNVVAIIDANGTSLDGSVRDVMGIEPIAGKWESFGWTALHVNGHDPTELLKCFESLPEPAAERPTAIIARTVKGKGVSFMESDAGWHLGYLGPADRERATAEIEARLQ